MTPLPLVLLGCAALAVVVLALVHVGLASDRRMAIHNMLAHPLLELTPPIGEWLHERTAPADTLEPDATESTRRLVRLLDHLEDEPTPPLVLVAPASVAARLTQDEAMAMVRAGITHVPPEWQPGMFRVLDEPSADDARGVLVIPSEVLDA